MTMQKKPYPIVGMFSAYEDATENTYYFTNDLLSDGIVIREATVLHDDRTTVETMLTVLHINKKDALRMGVYWGPLLHGIQTHGILTTINNLHRELSLDKFIHAIRDLSANYSSASMQDGDHAQEMNTEILEEIHKVSLLRY